MTELTRSLWAGGWHDGAGDDFERLNPSDGATVVATGTMVSPAQVEEAIGSGRAAFATWRSTPLAARCAVLRRAAGLLDARAAELGRELSREQGEVLAEGIGEVRRAAAILDYYGQVASHQVAEIYAAPDPGQEFRVSYHPVGVVGVVTPWNFPIAIPAWKIAPALVYGNTVVWKPASHVPLLAYRLAQVLDEAGLPAGVLSLVLGPGRTGQQIVESPEVDVVSFTGSTPVGRGLIETCGRLAKPIQAELGGKNVTVVGADADLDKAVAAVVVSAFSGNGQKCTATSRVVVEDDVAETFSKRLAERTRALAVGDPLDPGVDVGPVVSAADRDRIQQLVDESGLPSTSPQRPDEGWFVAPTVVDLERPAGPLWSDEIFGPVVAVTTAADFAESLRLADDTEYGLAAAVFTRDLARVQQAQEALSVGMLTINGPTTGGQPHVPFGGWRASGFGPREQGGEARAFFTKSRTTMVCLP